MKLADVKQGNIRFKMLYHELKNSRAQQLAAEEVRRIVMIRITHYILMYMMIRFIYTTNPIMYISSIANLK